MRVSIPSGVISSSCWTYTSPASIHPDEKRLPLFNQCRRRPVPFIYFNKFIRAHMAGVSPASCFSFAVCANCINTPRGLIELLVQPTMSGPLRACALAISKQGLFLLRLAASSLLITFGCWALLKHLDTGGRALQKTAVPACTLVPENSNSYPQPLLSWDYVVGQMGQLRAQGLATLRAERFCQAVLRRLSPLIDGEVAGGCWTGASPWEQMISLGPISQVVEKRAK